MKKLTAIVVVCAFIFAGTAAFAADIGGKDSIFSLAHKWFSKLGKTESGEWVWRSDRKKAPLDHEQILQRRGKVGSGMRGAIDTQ